MSTKYKVRAGRYGPMSGRGRGRAFVFHAQNDEQAALIALGWFGSALTWFNLYRDGKLFYEFGWEARGRVD